jgi:probable O-glycosylation ligase (exosortase A-associated)
MRDIALALFIFGMIPFILMRPFIGLLIWSWLGYMNPHRLCYGFAYSFPWVMLVAIVTLIGLLASKEEKRIPRSSFSVLILMFWLWVGVTTLFAAAPSAAWDKWEQFTKMLMWLYVTLILVNSRERMHWLVWMIVVSLGFYGLKGGVFTITHGGINTVQGPPNSFIADNNDLALALCMTIPLMRYLQLHSVRKFVRVGLGISMLLTGISVLGTYSRGGFIALAVVAGALFVKSRSRLTVVAVVIVIGFVAWNFMPAQWTERMDTLHHPTQTGSGETRIQSYKFAANVALHHPLLGGGFDDYLSASLWQQYAPEGSVRRAIHSIYFRVLGEHGFPGLILFLALLYVSWRNCSRVRKRSRDLPDKKWLFDLASMLQVSLVGFMAAGTFLPMPYFDLDLQLMALSAVLSAYCKHEIEAIQPVNQAHGVPQSESSPHPV